MSLTKKLGVSGAFVFSALLLANAMESRESLADISIANTSVVEGKVAPQIDVLKPVNPLMNSLLSANEVAQLLEQRLPGIKIRNIEKSPQTGFYQAFFGSEVIYVSENGQYLFTGNMLELAEAGPINHTQLAVAQQDAKQAPFRAESIAQLAETDMVVFKAAKEKFVISVFTDIDCAYCRKLHKEVPLLNDKGITVRYLAFPRAGLGSDAYHKLVSVWCADDKMAAMNDAKLNRQFGNFGKNSCTNPIADQYKLTREFNLSGTPSLILSDGELIGGYMPADDLLAHLSRKTNQQIEASPGH